MYVILVYDINLDDEKSAKILRNVYKTCKKYLNHIQNSVFEGEITLSKLLEMESKLKKCIRKDRDSVIVFKSRSKKWLDKEFIGKVEEDKTSNFL